jgi:hypothetical protein
VLNAFAILSTPLVADACGRTGVPLRAAPPGIRAVIGGQRVAGRALPVQHCGSVDVFLEALSHGGQGRSVLQLPAASAAGRRAIEE